MSDTKWSDWIDWNAKQDSESPIPDGTLSQVAFHNQDSIPDVSPEKWDWFRCKDPIFAYRYVLADMDVWTKPDWAIAHKNATHWDSMTHAFCTPSGFWDASGEYLLDVHSEWGTSRYWQRPTEKYWDGASIPNAGTQCEVFDYAHEKWNKIEITAIAKSHVVAIFNGEETLLKKSCIFRPLQAR